MKSRFKGGRILDYMSEQERTSILDHHRRHPEFGQHLPIDGSLMVGYRGCCFFQKRIGQYVRPGTRQANNDMGFS